MAFWRTTAETSATLATEEHSLAQISDGILAGVIAWTPATAIFFFSTIFIVRRYNPDFIFYGGLVVLFYMCVIGTGTVSYTHLRAPRDQRGSRMPSSA